MKTKFKYLTFVAAALLMSLGSCSNDDENVDTDNGSPKKVSLKIKTGGPSPKSETGPVADGTSITFNTGDLYFVSSSGIIVKHYSLSDEATSDSNINLDELKDGTTISNIPATAEAVYIAGNTADLPTSGNISEVQASVLSVTTQADIEDVNLYGTGNLTAPVTEGDPYTANVMVNPTVARIELENITGSGIITGFTVDGIFVDNYYSQATVAGAVNGDYLIFNGENATAFEDGSTQYPQSLSPAIYDWIERASTDNVVAPATEGDVWGYNLFASAAGSTVPRIVIRLSGITTNNENVTFSDPQFVTIRGFKSGGTSLSGILAGNVYNIGAGTLNIDETIITPEPNEDPIDVEVSIELATWTLNSVDPEI